jgi:glycosyltransferase involved in cell wall biosynthesis
MKIAIFHNFLDNIGGAEIVGLTLARELAADVYSTNIDYKQIHAMGFNDVPIYSIGKIPINAPWRQQSALYKFRHLDLRGKYDYFIIDGDWAMSGAVLNHPNLWYVHSPIREIWDLYAYTRHAIVPWYGRWGFDAWVRLNRFLNRRYIHHVDHLACNSENTHARIKKYLGREATVIYPPIEASQFFFEKSGDYWLSVNRLISHKRVELQMEAFRLLPHEKLIVVGSYEDSRHFQSYAKYIKKIKPENVEIRSWIDRQELISLYNNAKGLLATAYNEDFGMTLVEAMAAGKPVVAANEGGYKETVIDGITGFLIDDITAEKIVHAVKCVSKDPTRFRDACIQRARQFNTEIFIQKIKAMIGSRLFL